MMPSSAASAPAFSVGLHAREEAGGLRTTRFDSLASLEAVAPAWDEVQDRDPFRHVLMDRRWVGPWWKAFGDGKELHGLLVTKGGRPVGLAPTILSRGWEAWPSRDGLMQIADDYSKLSVPAWRRFVPVRRVTFPVNVPSHNARAHALVADDMQGVCAAVLDYWKEREGSWDVLVLEGLPTASGQAEAFADAAAARGFLNLPHGRVREMYRADLSGGLDAYLARRGGHFRKRRKELIRACQKAGRIDIAQYRGSDIMRGLDLMFDIERATWKARPGERSTVDMAIDERLRGFFTDAALAFAADDDAVVHVMSLDGRPVGAMFGLSRRSTMLTLVVYLRDDVLDVLNAAPLWDATIQDAIDRGMTELDTHGVSSHAKRWATHTDTYQRRYIFSSGARGRALWASKALATSASRWIASARSRKQGEHDGRN